MNSTGFVRAIKRKLHDWESRHLWTARFIEYTFLILLVSFIIAITFKFFNLIYTDSTSARYMLSALVQSQAAIVAIVISLTLIAVQLTASAYSPRVIRIFRDNPDMWILLLFYGISIFLGLFVLKMIRGAVDTSQIVISNISLEAYITDVYALGISTFMILFIYAWNIMGLLAPETIINRLTTEITKEKILNSEEDPIQPIMDIVHGSIMKYDLETTRVGLKAVTDKVIKIVKSENVGQDDEEVIIERFCNPLKLVSRLAISKDDERSTIEVIKSLRNFGKSAAEKNFKDATWRAVWYLREVGEAVAGKELLYATGEAAESLGEVGEAAAKKCLKDATRAAAESLGGVGVAALKKDLLYAARKAAESLKRVGKAAAVEKGLEDPTRRTARALLAFGVVALEKDFEDETKQAARFLAQLALLAKKPIKDAILSYESELTEQDCGFFQKFKELYGLYEQELEKLRSEKKDSE
jgi:hypothetical protein